MRRLLVLAVTALGLCANAALAQDARLTGDDAAVLQQLHPRTGTIAIREARATINLGSDYQFYDAGDARRILTEVWDNPPDHADGVLGLIMPAGATPYSDEWGAVVTYQATGYVTDDDARDADYAGLMRQMQQAADAAAAQQRAAGFAPVEVIGWAQSPRYDSVDHSVVWARELAFEGEDVHRLNYDMRTLGRAGVLSINIVAGMPQLAEIRDVSADFGEAVAFDQGARYDDFSAGTDEEAGYGIAGLVAGGAGLAVAKKVGVLAFLLKFLQPALVGLFALIALFSKQILSALGLRKAKQPARG